MSRGAQLAADRHRRPTPLLCVLVLLAVTLWAFAPVRHNLFVNWDDDHLLVFNEAYRGLGVENLRWMFSTTFGGHYQPLTWLSYALDYELWGGLSAGGVHLTNVLLHSAMAVGIYLLATKLIAAAAPAHAGPVSLAALAAALLFAIHPLRVESVAWATERRDVLSGALLVACVLLYLKATEAGDRTHPWAMAGSLIVYGASLLAKAAGVALPLVLLALDAYPLRRLPAKRSRSPQAALAWRQILAEKSAFAALALAASIAALYAQWHAGALRTAGEHGFGLRLGQAASAVFFYLGKMVWPAHLLPLYEQDPQAVAWSAEKLAATAGVLVLTAALWLLRARLPGLLVAWLCYLWLLLPVLGLAQSGPQWAADRYTYLASIPWAVWIGGGVAALWRTDRAWHLSLRYGSVLGMAVIAGGLAWTTRRQVGVWRDSRSLWTWVIQYAPQTGLAHANLAAYLDSQGDFQGARAHAARALDRLPGNRSAHITLGRASLALGDFATGEAHLRESLRIAAAVGKADAATAIELAAALAEQGKASEAEAVFRESLSVSPQAVAAHVAFGTFLARQDRLEEANAAFEKATNLEPRDPSIRAKLSIVLTRLGRFVQAKKELEQALQAHTDDVVVLAELAWLLAACPAADVRDGDRAIELASRAVTLSGGNSLRAVESLAAACAEAGDFARASALIETTLADNPDLPPAARSRMVEALDGYRSKRPFRLAEPQ